MGEEKVSIDYEREYHRVLARIASIEEERKNNLVEKDKFYNQLLSKKDKEIEWLKSVISGILHI